MESLLIMMMMEFKNKNNMSIGYLAQMVFTCTQLGFDHHDKITFLGMPPLTKSPCMSLDFCLIYKKNQEVTCI